MERPDLDFYRFREHARALFPESDEGCPRRNKVRALVAVDDTPSVVKVGAVAGQSNDIVRAITAGNDQILKKLEAFTTTQSAIP